MGKETKLKIMLCEVLLSVLICIALVLVKFVFKQEGIIEDIYNYLITDIVFLH